MRTCSFDPRAEKDALATALSEFRTHWAQNHSAEVIVEFCDAITRAEEVCAELERSPHASSSERELVSLLLHLLLAAARSELARVQAQSVNEMGQGIVPNARQFTVPPLLRLPAGTLPQCPACEEERGRQKPENPQEARGSSAPELPAGTILSCPQCEQGLYTVATPARVDDLVLDEGLLLQPLHPQIPQREAWRAFACPHCGGRYYRDGKFHTVHREWV